MCLWIYSRVTALWFLCPHHRNRVVGQVALAPSLINQCLTNQSCTLHAGCMCFSAAPVRACPYAVVLRCVSAYNKSLPTRQEHTMLSDYFLAFAPGRSICASNLIPPIIKGAALCDRQREKKQSLRVAFGRTINASHPIYQTEHLYVCLYVFVSAQSMAFILFIRV